MDLSEGMLEAAFERGELLASLFSCPRLMNSVRRGGGAYLLRVLTFSSLMNFVAKRMCSLWQSDVPI